MRITFDPLSSGGNVSALRSGDSLPDTAEVGVFCAANKIT